MKIVAYNYKQKAYIGLYNGKVVSTLFEYKGQNIAKTIFNREYNASTNIDLNINDIELISPIPNPTSMRDAYAFRQHVEFSRKNRGLEMIPEYDHFPIYYYSNHSNISGPGTINVMEKHLNKLDFELEIAIVISKEGININSQDADEYILGYMLMNDWSSRSIQIEEMKLNLGPAKGKDFATSLGPFLVTRDELKDYLISTPNGEKYDLDMICKVNNVMVSADNMKNMTWTFAQIIERVSYGTTIYPGDIIGSGTCATGCFLELNYANKSPQWLKNGDKVELSATGLGKLNNTISLIK